MVELTTAHVSIIAGEREPLRKDHHAFDWALAAVKADPELVDREGRIMIPEDAVEYVTPTTGRPYAHVHKVFALDDAGQPVLTSDGLDVQTRPVDKKFYRD